MQFGLAVVAAPTIFYRYRSHKWQSQVINIVFFFRLLFFQAKRWKIKTSHNISIDFEIIFNLNKLNAHAQPRSLNFDHLEFIYKRFFLTSNRFVCVWEIERNKCLVIYFIYIMKCNADDRIVASRQIAMDEYLICFFFS